MGEATHQPHRWLTRVCTQTNSSCLSFSFPRAPLELAATLAGVTIAIAIAIAIATRCTDTVTDTVTTLLTITVFFTIVATNNTITFTSSIATIATITTKEGLIRLLAESVDSIVHAHSVATHACWQRRLAAF